MIKKYSIFELQQKNRNKSISVQIIKRYAVYTGRMDALGNISRKGKSDLVYRKNNDGNPYLAISERFYNEFDKYWSENSRKNQNYH